MIIPPFISLIVPINNGKEGAIFDIFHQLLAKLKVKILNSKIGCNNEIMVVELRSEAGEIR